jgi:propanediol dehydratase large subunit
VKRSKRMQVLDNRPVNKDGFIDEWPEKGFVAMLSPYDPSPSISIEDGKVVEMDGKKREDFDFMDHFIADHYIDVTVAKESMEIPTIDIARMLVDINVPREEIIKLAKGFTPAKLTRVMSHLNVVEMMMAMQKMRSRKHPANQAHITNAKDNPVLIAADAAEGALRGFREEETTVGIARYAPFNAIGLLVGSQIGARGVLTQCSVEEAVELQLGMRGFTTYAETISVYGTEKVFIDGDDTPYSKAFLASAYASRGLKMRYTSGTGSEVLMGNAEKKSMLYLETRCLMVTKGAGVQGIQNGSVSCVGITASVPSGVRAILAENLIAAILDLEVASSNDQTFSHSDIRRTARMLMQMLPGTDFIFSGYSGVPNKDNMFAGSNFDAEDFDDYNVIQRDLKVDGGLRPVKEEDVIKVRNKAAKAMQAIFKELGFPEITDEEVEAATYAHSSDDVPDRDVIKDLAAIDELMKTNVTGIDIIKALYKSGYEDVAESLLEMFKQRMTGDYLHTAAILDTNFKVQSAVNYKNDYMGPGTGYQMSNQRWEEIKAIPHIISPEQLQ